MITVLVVVVETRHCRVVRTEAQVQEILRELLKEVEPALAPDLSTQQLIEYLGKHDFQVQLFEEIVQEGTKE